jgi:small multidrug resistance family-3 protein
MINLFTVLLQDVQMNIDLFLISLQKKIMEILKTLGLFAATAIAEIIGCYLPYLWLKEGKSFWLLLPAAISLGVFVWLLTLHPQAAGRVYAAYGGVYIFMALMWLWAVDAVRPTTTDWIGVSICLIGVIVIMYGRQFVRYI